MQRYRVNYTLLIGLLVGSVVAAGSIYGIWSWQMTGNAQSLLKRANEAEANGNFTEAASLLNNYLAFQPEDDQARIKQANLYVDIGNQALEDQEIRDFAAAKDAIINTLFKYPGEDELRAELVEMLMKPNIAQYFAKDVLGHVKTLLAKNPDDAELLRKQALCLNSLKQPAEAVEVLQRMVGYDPLTDAFNAEAAVAPNDIAAYRMLSRILVSQLQREKLGVRVEDQMIEVNPDSAEAYLERGRFLAAIDKGEGSRSDYGEKSSKDLAKAYELDAENPEILLALAAEAQADEKFDLTREYLEKGLELGTDIAVFYSGLGRLEREKGDHESAIEQIERGLKNVSEGQRPYLLLDKIDFQIDAKNIAGAEATIKQLEREVEIKLPQVEFHEARILASRNEWLRASRALEEVRPKLAGDPRLRPQLDMLLGLSYRKVGFFEKALEVFQQLQRENPGNKFAKAQVDDLLRRRGDTPTASGSGGFNERLAEELAKPEEEQNWEAFDDFLVSWCEEQDRSEVQRKLLQTQVLVSRKQYSEARTLLRDAYESAPDDLAVQRAVVRLVAVDPDRGPETSMQLLDRTVKRFGDQWQLRLDRADLYLAMNNETLVEDLLKLTEGIDEFESGKQFELWKGIATRLGRAGKREESEAAWKKVAQLDPNDLPTLMQVFDMALIRNDDEAMREAQQKVYDLVGSKNDANWAFTEAARKFVQLRNDPSQKQLRDDILKLVDTALQQRPDWNAPYILRAGLAMSERDYLAALKDYKEGFSRGRGNAQALSQYVKLLDAQGNYNEALEQLDQFNAATSVMLVGRIYPRLLLRVGRYRDALEAADRIAAAGEKNANTQLWYGDFARTIASVSAVPEDLRDESQQKASTALETAVELGGSSPAPWLAHITQLLATKNLAGAEEALHAAQLKLEEDQQQLLKARCYEMMGRWFDAENIYRLAYQQNPESEQVARQLATFYLSKRYPRPDGRRKAVALINAILHEYADDPESVSSNNANWARRTAAKMLADTGDYQNSLSAEKLLASNAINGTLAVEDKLQMATLLAVRPEPVSRNKAIRLLEEVESQQRLSPQLDLALGKLYYAIDNWPKCRDHMQTVLTRYSDSFGPRDAYIRMLLDRAGPSDLRIAESQVRQLIQIAPRAPATLELVSLVYRKLGDDDKAQQALRRMLPPDLSKLDANGYRLVARVAMLLIAADDIETAEKLLSILVKRPDATMGDQLQFAQFVGTHRDVETGMKMLDQLLTDSNLLSVADTAVKIVRSKRDEIGDKYDQKIDGWFDRAERDDPGAIPVLLARANFRDIQQRYEEAASIYRTVLGNDDLAGKPKAAVLNNLAYLLALGAADEKSPGEAVTLLGEAVEILGPIADILDTRATIWIGRGEFQAAVDDMRLAVTERPTASKYFHKSLAHMGLGQNSDALEAWNKAEDLGLDRESVGHLEAGQYDKLKSKIEALKGQGGSL